MGARARRSPGLPRGAKRVVERRAVVDGLEIRERAQDRTELRIRATSDTRRGRFMWGSKTRPSRQRVIEAPRWNVAEAGASLARRDGKASDRTRFPGLSRAAQALLAPADGVDTALVRSADRFDRGL